MSLLPELNKQGQLLLQNRKARRSKNLGAVVKVKKATKKSNKGKKLWRQYFKSIEFISKI